MLSVVMPVYNCGLYLRESIESILNQTYEDFEFIIIDDGSTDDSLEIIKKYKEIDSRIILISRKNKGLVQTINEAINFSSGNYIARMDGDDTSDDRRLEKQMEYIGQHPNVDVLAAYGDLFGNIDEELAKIDMERFNFTISENKEEYCLMNIGATLQGTWVCKKDIFRKLNGYSSKYKAEEVDFIFRALQNGATIRVLPEILYHYRKYDLSHTQKANNKVENLKAWFYIKLDYIENTNKLNFNGKRVGIWGAGQAGAYAKDTISERYPEAKIINFFDKYKRGKFNSLEVLPIEKINWDFYDIIVGATTPGRKEILKYMEDNNKQLFKDYLIFV